jgi:hypothetical protein
VKCPPLLDPDTIRHARSRGGKQQDLMCDIGGNCRLSNSCELVEEDMILGCFLLVGSCVQFLCGVLAHGYIKKHEEATSRILKESMAKWVSLESP